MFTVKALIDKASSEENDKEDSQFYNRVAQLTKAQPITVAEPAFIKDVIIGICCACQGPDLLQVCTFTHLKPAIIIIFPIQ